MISIYKEKAFDKIYYLLMIILKKRDIQGTHLNIKVIYTTRELLTSYPRVKG